MFKLFEHEPPCCAHRSRRAAQRPDRGELDEAKRAGMYAEMQLLVRDQGGVVIPVFTSYVFAMADKVQHGPMWGNWDLDGLRLVERWWMA